jgi:hypothetical protein
MRTRGRDQWVSLEIWCGVAEAAATGVVNGNWIMQQWPEVNELLKAKRRVFRS